MSNTSPKAEISADGHFMWLSIHGNEYHLSGQEAYELFQLIDSNLPKMVQPFFERQSVPVSSTAPERGIA
jgi:hypothetical protein